MDSLGKKIQYIKGVGPKRGQLLRKLNINTVEELIYYFPKDYEDRSNFTLLHTSSVGSKVNLEVEVIGVGNIIRKRNNISILKVPFKDESGMGYLVWFNQNYLIKNFKVGDKLKVNGKLNKIGSELQILNPVFEESINGQKLGRIVPKYNLTEGLSNNFIINIVEEALKEILSIKDILPPYLIKKYNLLKITEALMNIHFPTSKNMLKRARERLVFDELMVLQLGLLSIKNGTSKEVSGIGFPDITDMDQFINNLPFTLTNSQSKVLYEIQRDMDSKKQMNRLVQGDVGSGKTIIAAIALFRCVKSGYQGTMMAPTEILAIQHFESLQKLFLPWGIKVGLLVGSLTEKQKKQTLAELEDGTIDIVVGTHAIIQDKILFNNLGLAITDEQHRFGVKQRAILSKKGENPDIIVMTATPIPRTLALILYGDLDISIIDELPPGRRAIETYAINPSMIERMNKFIDKQIKDGRQAYIVCPLIEESESISLNSAEELYIELKNKVFNEYEVGLLHGKMSPKDKEEIMLKFKSGKINILVSTTVIEVGVNVPNASIMAIYNAERFGLAQLHQLRGRVGRGNYQSYCILINYANSNIARERMRILQSTSDGFIISEKDLELRGPGEFFGTRQHGIPELKISNLFKDVHILQTVQKEALIISEEDPLMVNEQYRNLRSKVLDLFKENLEDLSLN